MDARDGSTSVPDARGNPQTSAIDRQSDTDPLIGESAAACQPIDAVIAAQSGLVEVVHTLRQLVNVKG